MKFSALRAAKFYRFGEQPLRDMEVLYTKLNKLLEPSSIELMVEKRSRLLDQRSFINFCLETCGCSSTTLEMSKNIRRRRSLPGQTVGYPHSQTFKRKQEAGLGYSRVKNRSRDTKRTKSRPLTFNIEKTESWNWGIRLQELGTSPEWCPANSSTWSRTEWSLHDLAPVQRTKDGPDHGG